MRLTSIVNVFKRCEEPGSEREVVIIFNNGSPQPIGRLTVWRPKDGGTAELYIKTEDAAQEQPMQDNKPDYSGMMTAGEEENLGDRQ